MSTWQKDNRIALENDLPRADILEKVTGKAKFTTDYYLPNMIWARDIRCPYGQASLLVSNEEKARAIKGVLELKIERREGNYAGASLGYICAESKEVLEKAMQALGLKFEPGPVKTDLQKEASPLEQFEENINKKRYKKIFNHASHTQEFTYQTEVQTHCCLEPHICIVDYQENKATIWSSTQGTFSVRDGLENHLDLRPDQIEVHSEYIGGGFGSKFGAGREGVLAAQLSKKYKRPCRIELTRKEEQQTAGMRPGSLQYIKIALDDEGLPQGGRIHTWGSVGPAGRGGGVKVARRYNFGTLLKTHEDVVLNGGNPRAMRAPGHPQGMFAEAMLADDLARMTGKDPLNYRIKIDENETRRKMYEVGAELIGWSRRKPDGTWPGIFKTGFGIGSGDWGNRQGEATVEVHIYRGGEVEVLNGSQDMGTGFRTVLRDIVKHKLKIPAKWINVKIGVTTYPEGPASGGSKTTRIVAPRAFLAAERAKEKLMELVQREHGTTKISWEKACALIPNERLTGRASNYDAYWKEPTQSEAVQFAEVEVDTETGIVRVKKLVALQEMGLPVNRLTAENQISGGVVQGLSFALFEQRILDRQTGAMMNADMEWYKIAGTVDIPEIVPIIWKSRNDISPNSLGEPPTIPTAGAIACAVANALGVPVRNLPLTPQRILTALNA